jgi:chitobiase/beta-hexosaminidase-like protein/BACON domain-containing protein
MMSARNPVPSGTIRISQSTATKSIAIAPAPRIARRWILLLSLVALAGAFPALAAAQEFAPIPALVFNTTAGAGSPLPQTVTVTSTGASFTFSAAASTNSGGSWLTIPTSIPCCGDPTPFALTIAADSAANLAAGTYTGQVVLTPSSNSISPLTIPITLIVHPTTATYFDQVAGGLTFTLQSDGETPPGQLLQVRNAGAGALAWTGSTTTADGGQWLSLSATSGTAPSNLTVGIVLAKLPGLGITAGTFSGQVLLKTSSDSVTIPITVIVGSAVFRQINPLNFDKTFAGGNPLPQVLTVAGTGSAINFSAKVLNATGGDWLTVSSNAFGCCGANTPSALTFTVNPAVTLAAGTYMAEVVVSSEDGSEGLNIPVTLAVDASTAAYFDDVAGALSFSLNTGGDAPAAQSIRIRNAGSGTLAWTAQAIEADGGSWLSVSAASGTAPDLLSVSIKPESLPSSGLIAGTFTGQIALQSGTSRITIPVTVPVGPAEFRQVNPLNFIKPYAGANPLSQVITIASTGTSFPFAASTVSSTGGSWLVITPSSYGCCGYNTPQAITVGVNPAITLAAGTYTSEILVQSEAGDQTLAIPVTLTIEPTTATFFDAVPGQMSFFMVTKGNAPPPQVLPIRNAGAGTLDWTATTATTDGGNWLAISAESGVAPANPTVSIIPANLPGGGLVAGTFTGQVILLSGGTPVTVPVSMTVGANVFRQINPLEFTMTVSGANPLPQVVTVASTGTNFAFFATVANSTGGNWLSINPSSFGCCGLNTPQAIVVSVNPAVTLTAGTYSSEVIVTSADGTQGITIPVTLNIEAKTSAYFDSLRGALSFSMITNGSAPPAQPIEIRNAGAGSLAWTASLTTSDGGNWLAISAASGTAPSVPTVTVLPANLPGGGLTAGTFSGQVILATGTNRVTIPVSMVVGAGIFRQVNALDFNMTYGGANPLPQLFNVPSNGANFAFFATAVNSTGGNWLSINPSSFGCCGINTPQQMIVTVAPPSVLAVGTYTSEIIFTASNGSPSMVVPVTLRVNAATTTYFDDMPGGVGFVQVTGGANPASQTIPIRNAGTATLDWSAAVTTSDGASWLSISSPGGTAPSTLTISIKSASLPGKGLVAGIFNGQILLTSGSIRQTIPVQAVVSGDVFDPVAPLSFSKSYDGANPTYQILNVNSTGASIGFFAQANTDYGGNWLVINPSSFGCCGQGTPLPIQVSINPAITLAAGSYVGEIVITSSAGDQGFVVPVTMTINDTGVPAATPTFNPPGGVYPGSQSVTIADAARDAAIHYTIDGTAPSATSPVYSGPISITASGTILQAIAIAPGYGQSATGKATYTISNPLATPAASQVLTITEATSGTTIHYTLNGPAPTPSSPVYTGPITISGTGATTLQFIAVNSSDAQSAVRTVTITVK